MTEKDVRELCLKMDYFRTILIININLFVSGNKRSFDNISSKNRFHLIVKLNEQKISKNN